MESHLNISDGFFVKNLCHNSFQEKMPVVKVQINLEFLIKCYNFATIML